MKSVSSQDSIIRKARLFDFYARHLWRFHRVFVRRHLASRCARCVNSAAYVDLDALGVCRVCREQPTAAAVPAEANAEEGQLESLIGYYTGRGRGNYDALVMISGGKDGAFLLWELIRRLPQLRMLAFTIDNGFMSPVALGNATQNVTKLGIDHMVFRPAAAVFAKGFRYAIRHLEPGKGCLQTIDRIDGTIGFDASKQFACRNGIPLILFGFNHAQMRTFFGVDGFEVPGESVTKKTTHIIGKTLSAIYSDEELRHFWDPARFPESEVPRLLAPLCLMRYNEEEVRTKVTDVQLIDPGNDSPLVTNNAIVQMMVVLDYLHLGYADFEPECADMVRAGDADRRYWLHVFEMLEYSAKTGWLIEKDLDRIAARLDINRVDVGLVRKR